MSDEQAGSLNKACSDYRCSHSLAVSADRSPDDVQLLDIEPRFACTAYGKRWLSLMSWSRAFHVPIPLPDGRMLRTLRDAGEYIQELPKATHQRPEWQIAAGRKAEPISYLVSRPS